MNHDGFGDIVSSDGQTHGGGAFLGGKAFVLFGPSLTDVIHIEAGDATPLEQLGFGAAAMSIGDANGDGEFDVLLGGPGYQGPGGLTPDTGRARLFLGPGFGTNIIFDDPNPEQGAEFGKSVLLADLDGDGLDDVTVGAPRASRGTVPEAGQVLTWFAPAWSATPVEASQPHPKQFGFFGQHLAAVQNAGPAEDLLVNASDYLVPGQISGRGLAYRFAGRSLGLVDTIMPPSIALFQFAQYGRWLDVNGDGVEDMGVSNFDGQYDAAVLSGLDLESAIVTFPEPAQTVGVGYGFELAMSDLDRDGHVDALVSEADYSLFSGAVHVYWGPDFTSADLIGPDFFGFDLPSFGHGLQVGDLNADGYDEILGQISGFGQGILYVLQRRTLHASAGALAVSGGPTITFDIDFPPERGGHSYLGLLSFTPPGDGIVLGPGSHLPLYPDALTQVGLSLLGTPILGGFLSTLDVDGNGTMQLNWPAYAGTGLIGGTLYVTVLTSTPDGTLGPGTNAVPIEIVL